MSSIYQVAELKQLISRGLKPLFYQIEELYGMVTVEGVIDRVNSYPSGTYIALKDPQSTEVSITCLIAPRQKIDFELKAGLKIQSVGTIEMRPRKNNADHETVIMTNKLFDVSKGELTETEKLREELRKLGYFENKKPLPSIADKPEIEVCVISSADGVAFRDIESTLKTTPYFKLNLYPANLYSPEDVANSIEEADRGNHDILLVSRGGGNRLDVFDQLPVLTAIRNTKTPIIVAVGHAQDNTLADEVADQYAATPTAAGEYLAQLYKTYEIKKKEIELTEREKSLEKLVEKAVNDQAEERKKLLKQIEEQQAFIKALEKNVTTSEKYQKQIETLKNRLRDTENKKSTIRLTPGFILFCAAMLAVAYFIFR